MPVVFHAASINHGVRFNLGNFLFTRKRRLFGGGWPGPGAASAGQRGACGARGLLLWQVALENVTKASGHFSEVWENPFQHLGRKGLPSPVVLYVIKQMRRLLMIRRPAITRGRRVGQLRDQRRPTLLQRPCRPRARRKEAELEKNIISCLAKKANKAAFNWFGHCNEPTVPIAQMHMSPMAAVVGSRGRLQDLPNKGGRKSRQLSNS